MRSLLTSCTGFSVIFACLALTGCQQVLPGPQQSQSQPTTVHDWCVNVGLWPGPRRPVYYAPPVRPCQPPHAPHAKPQPYCPRCPRRSPVKSPKIYASSIRRFGREPVFGYLPDDLRVHNWTKYGSGSCVIASLCMCANKQGCEDVAEKLRATYGGGQGAYSTNRILSNESLPYAYTTAGDEDFLRWASDTGRGAALEFGWNHVQYFDRFVTGVDGQEYGVIINNNTPEKEDWYTVDDLLREWRRQGGWAVTINSAGGGLPNVL